MRNQNPKLKQDQTVTLLKIVTYQFLSSGNWKVGGVLECWFCTSLVWGLHPAGEFPCRKRERKWRGSGDDKQIEEKDITSFPAWSTPRFTTLQISPSAELHWCHDIVFNYKTTSPCCLVHPFPHFLKSTALQPWVSATGASEYARLFRELVIFSWNWPGHNGERCQILRTPFQAWISWNRPFWLSFPDLSSATFLFLGPDKRWLRMEQIG